MLLLSILLSGTLSAQSPSRMLEMADAALENHQYEKALELYDRCLAADASLKEAYRGRALVRERLGKTDEALTDYNVYLSMHPEHYEALFSRAALRYQKGFYQPAKEDFLKLMSLAPGETTTVYFEMNRYTGGVSNVFTMQKDSKSAVLHYLGLTSMALQQCREALHYYDSAIVLTPDQPTFYRNRALARRSCADSLGASQDLLRAQQLQQKVNKVTAYEWIAQYDGKPLSEQELRELNELLESQPRASLPYAVRADYYMNRKQYQLADDDLTKALRYDTLNAELWYNRAIARDRLNHNQLALLDYTAALSLNENYQEAWLNRGSLLVKLGRVKEAMDDFGHALAIDPEYGAALYNRAVAWHLLGNKKEACYDLRRAREYGVQVPESVAKKICGL